MDQPQRLAIEHSLREMTRKGWVDICTIKKIVETVGCVPHGESLRTLELLHCVHFKDMDAALLKELPAIVSRVINGPVLRFEQPGETTIEVDFSPALPEPLKVKVEEAAKKKPGLIARLLA